MSLIKLLKIPIGLFKKDVITFLIVRRHDLNITDETLRYVAVKPTASISQLRQKVWHLLDLPDFCEEIIILKSGDRELPLTSLRKGNNPHNPYILEVWLPNKLDLSTVNLTNNMITMGNKSITEDNFGASGVFERFKRTCNRKEVDEISALTTNINESSTIDQIDFIDNQNKSKNRKYEIKSDLSCKFSSSSLFFKIHGKKSRDNFANILLKIQNDLSTLNNKLSDLENRIKR